jgi:tripartite-type tricarboxylate transporter receptor subunit TctC
LDRLVALSLAFSYCEFMTPILLRFLGGLVGGLAIVATVSGAHADTYPSKAVRVIINSSPGGLTDVVGRLVVNRMTQSMGQTFVVDNRSGSPSVGVDAVAKAAPDGYTLGVFASSLTALPALVANLPFNPQTDLVPVALLSTAPLVMVTGVGSDYRSVADFIRSARARPAQVSFASGGIGTMGHLLAEQFQAEAGLSLVHVPYRGGAPAMADVLAGHVPVFFDTIGTTLPLAKEGKIRPLAIVDKVRSPALPDVPTLAEAGFPGVVGLSWFALFAPVGTPPDLVARLNTEANRALQSVEIRERLVSLGTSPGGGAPTVLGEFVGTEVPRWTRLIRERQIKVN